MFQTFSWQRLMRRFAVGFMISMLALLIVGGTASLGTPQVTVEAQEATAEAAAELEEAEALDAAGRGEDSEDWEEL